MAGSIGLAHHRDLTRVNAHGHVKAHRRGVSGLFLQALDIEDIQMYGIERETAERGRGEQDGRADMSGHVTIGTVGPPARATAKGGDQVFGTPHHSHGGIGRGDFGGAHGTARGLHQRDDITRRKLDDLGRRFGLGQHHRGIGGACEGLQIAGLISSTARIDTHHRAFRVQRGVPQRIARGRLLRLGHAVLEVENHHVGRGGSLRKAFRTIGRAEQPPRTGGTQVHCASLMDCFWTSVVRTARATTSPCWLRAMCSSVTMPSPGRLFDSRLPVQTVSA
ncbi:Uncharacterised protein [Mycobacterium tuberculosis]|uniref:Uncharacterized protein n=1 Tax=Mycobacterium tuberculosis TaxID=1773 RepID=A0A654TS66_MYCTX|nr:Uncharacterised protein [Mycobacterium tuberculosis]CKN09223.1 Uncharacterised protein [Mycobacterium tuberculosis]